MRVVATNKEPPEGWCKDQRRALAILADLKIAIENCDVESWFDWADTLRLMAHVQGSQKEFV